MSGHGGSRSRSFKDMHVLVMLCIYTKAFGACLYANVYLVADICCRCPQDLLVAGISLQGPGGAVHATVADAPY